MTKPTPLPNVLRSVDKLDEKNGREVRAMFLTETQAILRDVIRKALGKDSPELPGWYYGFEPGYRDWVLAVLKPVIEKSADINRIDAENIGSVMEALAKGKITAVEAKQLIELLNSSKNARMMDFLDES